MRTRERQRVRCKQGRIRIKKEDSRGRGERKRKLLGKKDPRKLKQEGRSDCRGGGSESGEGKAIYWPTAVWTGIGRSSSSGALIEGAIDL